MSVPTLKEAVEIILGALQRVIDEVAKIISENASIIARAFISLPLSYMVQRHCLRTLKRLDKWIDSVLPP